MRVTRKSTLSARTRPGRWCRCRKVGRQSAVGGYSELLRVAGFWYCVPVTGQPKPVQPKPVQSEPTLITPLLIMPPVGTRL
ncbi:unnamed protein product [Phytophthora lilii]|uniref:Unnamed protein product n=1 Tax=Phytophthora lilii TaxID=2077276 RepID=A0A9W6XWH4_9STRA|nr:unnamed protein product [Phytophthora lilii]